MAQPLDGAFERVTRAGEHIATLKDVISDFTDSVVKVNLEHVTEEQIADFPDGMYIYPLPVTLEVLTVPPRCGVLAGC